MDTLDELPEQENLVEKWALRIVLIGIVIGVIANIATAQEKPKPYNYCQCYENQSCYRPSGWEMDND